jgi:hypothetical protein
MNIAGSIDHWYLQHWACHSTFQFTSKLDSVCLFVTWAEKMVMTLAVVTKMVLNLL